MKTATESHVAMLRGAITMAWAYGSLKEDVKTRVLAFINIKTQLSEAQKAVLRADIDTAIPLDRVWGDITQAQDRSHLINIATLISWEDEEFSTAEQKAYVQITELHGGTLDIAAMRADMATMAKAAKERWESEEDAALDDTSFPVRMVAYLERVFA